METGWASQGCLWRHFDREVNSPYECYRLIWYPINHFSINVSSCPMNLFISIRLAVYAYTFIYISPIFGGQIGPISPRSLDKYQFLTCVFFCLEVGPLNPSFKSLKIGGRIWHKGHTFNAPNLQHLPYIDKDVAQKQEKSSMNLDLLVLLKKK